MCVVFIVIVRSTDNFLIEDYDSIFPILGFLNSIFLFFYYFVKLFPDLV